MPNSYYNHSTYPAPNAPGSSAALRAELDLVTAGFNLLPTLSGNGYKVAMINAAGTALIASAALQALAITASTIDSTPIGATTRAAGNFTTLQANAAVNLGSSVTISGGTINGTQIGNTTASSGAFTTLTASGGITGALTGNVIGNVTGNVTGNLSGNVTTGSGTSTFNDVTINGTLDMNSGSVGTITGLALPTNSSDAANKQYVDNVAQGLDVKASCRVATTANITLSGTQTIDGVAVIAGDRVLVKNQTNQGDNGVYVAAAGGWTRSTDMDAWSELPGAFLFIEEGTVNDNSGWVCTVSSVGTLGGTNVTFEQFSGAGQITAGAGMVKSGNTLNVQSASASRIVVGADEIDLASTGVSAGTYKSVTVDVYGRITAATNPTTVAGFGLTDVYTKTEIDSIFGSTTAAAASASAAATSATNAANSATAAAGSATSASNSASTTLGYLNSFRAVYIGAATSNPTVDGTGGALAAGDLYFNTAAAEMRVYNGSSWLAAYLPAAGYLALAGGTMTGNLGFNGTGLRITADLSNATPASRLMVQTSTANSQTLFGLIPNGTSQNAQFQVHNSSDPNNASVGTLTAAAATIRIVSANTGTGTLLPLAFIMNATEIARFATTGNLLVNTTTDNTTDKVQVNGTIKSLAGGFVFPDSTTQTTAGASTGKAIAMAIVFS